MRHLFVVDADTSLLENIVAVTLRRKYGDGSYFWNSRNAEVDFVIPEEELAIQAGLGSSTIQRFEQGKGGTFENFLRIVMALGLVRELETLLLPVKNSIEDVLNLQEVNQRQRASHKGKP